MFMNNTYPYPFFCRGWGNICFIPFGFIHVYTMLYLDVPTVQHICLSSIKPAKRRRTFCILGRSRYTVPNHWLSPSIFVSLCRPPTPSTVHRQTRQERRGLSTLGRMVKEVGRLVFLGVLRSQERLSLEIPLRHRWDFPAGLWEVPK